MSVVTVYSKPDCHLCEEAMVVLRGMQAQLAFELHELDIDSDYELLRAYFERIPVVLVDGEEVCEYFVQEAVVRARLTSV